MILFINNIKSVRRQSKNLVLSTNMDPKSLETGDKWQSKTLFLTIFNPRLSIVIAFSIVSYPVLIFKERIFKEINLYGCV